MQTIARRSFSILMALCLSLFLVMPSFLAPKKAQAVAPAVAVAGAVGAVLCTALAVYGIQSVSSGHTQEDVATEFMVWLDKKISEGGQVATLLAAHGIYNLQQATNSLYSMFLDGYINLATFTYNAVNGISGFWGEILQLWAADNFGVSTAPSDVTFGDLTLNIYYSDQHLSNADSGSIYNNIPYCVMVDKRSRTLSFLTPNNADALQGFGLQINPYNGDWRLGTLNADGSTLAFSAVFTMVFVDGVGDTVAESYGVGNVSSSSYGKINEVEFFLNSYYSFFLTYTGNNTVDSAVVSYTPSTGWQGDVSLSNPDEINYGLWGDAEAAGHSAIEDCLHNNIPLGSDFVYNPSTQALEQQGSVPVIQDWSKVTDWSDVLTGERSALLDGTDVIDNSSAIDVSNTATGDIVDDMAIDDVVDTPHISVNPDGGSIPGALDFAGGQMLDRFPFCTIRDLQLLADYVSRAPSVPVFNLPIVTVSSSGAFSVESVPIDLTPWEPVAQVLRFMIGLLIILGFIFLAVRQVKVFNEE